MQTLEQLSAAATQGEWETAAYYSGTGPDEKCSGLVEVDGLAIGIIDEEPAAIDSLSYNLEFICTLVNLYRTGQLVEVQTDDATVERVARALCIYEGRNPDAPQSAEYPDAPRWFEYRGASLAAIAAMKGPKP